MEISEGFGRVHGFEVQKTRRLDRDVLAVRGLSAAVADQPEIQRFEANGAVIEMVNIPAGTFLMGSPESEAGRQSDEGPRREVRIKAFQLGMTEVTQALWKAVMGSNPSFLEDCGPTCPVEGLSWDDTQEFIGKLNALTGGGFRLPTEAEWEYSARAGCDTPFNVGGQCRTKIEPSEANFAGSYTYNGSRPGIDRRKSLPVASFAANGFGLFDMHGNVWEWVQDGYEDSYKSAPTDGSAVKESSYLLRVLRGGSWDKLPHALRAAFRAKGAPDDHVNTFGIYGVRLARSIPPVK